MKQLQLDLQKRLLIVEADEIELSIEGIIYKDQDSQISDLIEGKYKLICKGSELTEEVAKGLAIQFGETTHFSYYASHKGERGYYITALDSFISAIESKGYYWETNPIEYKRSEWEVMVDNNKYCRAISKEEIKFIEAESRTFNLEKTLILEIV